MRGLVFFMLVAGAFFARALEVREWSVDGVTRQALVHLPEASDRVPLVFVFHGHGGTAAGAARSFRIHEIWPEAVVVYPQGLPTPGQLTDPDGKKSGWNSDPQDAANRDLQFFDVMYAALKERADLRRVFSTGHSNGGGFTYCLWAARGDAFAALAPSGSAASKALRWLDPKPALHLAGLNDPLVKYEWQERTIRAVAQLNGCGGGEPWASSGSLTGTLYPSSAGTPLITLIHPGGHAFPEAAPELIVRFFKECGRQGSGTPPPAE